MTAFFKLIATAFPGGYRFVAVNFIALFATASVSDSFAHAFFMVSFLATFSGIAISTQSYVANLNLGLPARVGYLLILLALVAPPAFLLWEGSYIDYLVIVIAAAAYSFFEIVRADLMASGRFKALFLSACFAILLLPVSYYFNQASPFLLALCIFASLMCSVLFCIDNKEGNSPKFFDVKVTKDIVSYACSNGLSTALTFMLPILLAKELGGNSATALAQTVTLAMLAYFIPRYLSAGFLVHYKASLDWSLVKTFEFRVLIYTAVVSVAFWLSFYLLMGNELVLALLFVALLFTQVSLPQANVLMVHGAGSTQLKINLATFLFFVVAIAFIYGAFEQGELRAQFIVISYMGLVVSRYLTLKACCRKAEFKEKHIAAV